MWHADNNWKRFMLRWLGISLALHAIAAVMSQGFYHSDEHFQILEFLNWKLGNSPAVDLPIEFAEKMRPWLQPAILYWLTRFWQLLGIQDPFTWALSFRIISSLGGWFSVVGLALCVRHWIKEDFWRRAAVIALSLFWYLPAFHARTSSENWGGSIFIIGLCLFLLTRVYDKRGSPWIWGGLCGFLFGLSFEFRYQMATMVIGALLWFWIRAKIGWKESIALIAGGIFAVALGTGVDAWGYGSWTFAPWNYVDFNLIRNMVSSVDTDPWWDLYRRAFTESWPLLGFLLLVSLPVAWLTSPWHVLTWSHVPFFLTHAIIGHKELRFLFPLMHAAPVLFILAIHNVVSRTSALKFMYRWTFKVFLAWNLVALVVMSLMPAWMPIRFLDFLWHFKEQTSEEIVLHWKDKNPFDVNGIAMHFYRPGGVRTEKIQDYPEVLVQIQPRHPYWLFYDGFRLEGSAEVLRDHCRPEFKALPHGIEAATELLGISRILNHVTNWSLYRCDTGDLAR